MKRVILILTIALTFNSCKTETAPTIAPNTYQVNLKGEGIYNGLRAHLNALNSRRRAIPVDTAMFVNEAATFTGDLKSATMRRLTVNGVKGELEFVLEPGITTIDINKQDIKSSKIVGGPITTTHIEYKKRYDEQNAAIVDLKRQANKARQANDTLKYEQLAKQTNDKVRAMDVFANTFIDEHPDSEYSLLLLENIIASKKPNIDRIKTNLVALEEVIKKNPANVLIGKKIEAFIAQNEAIKDVDLGKIAPEFSALTPDGKELALSDVKGKATIIDFWASWCGPCRRENPNVVKVYEKYHDKGLEIISVSLDRTGQKDRWIKAIEKDKMSWHHVSNLKYWNDPIARKYSVKSIPAMFVLDEEGKIVAKKLRGKALEDQIASMLN